MCLGPPLHHSFAKIFASDDKERIDRAIEIYRERFREVGMFENAVYPEISETLLEFTKRDHPLYVATSKPRVFAEKILAHFKLTHFFNRIHGSELDGRLSDKAELIAHVVASENLRGSLAMIGDREHDMRGARKNGIDAIGVLWGYGSKEELSAAGAKSLVSRPTDLLSRLA